MKQLGTLGICAAIFATLGPLLGGAFFFACMMLGLPGQSSLSDLVSPGMSLVYVFLFFGAYLLGAIPAAATGLTFGLIVSRRQSGRLLSVLLGAGLGLLVCLTFELALAAPQGEITDLDWIFPLAGAFSGSLCGLLCSMVRVGPNNSFKPNPLRGSA